MEHYILEGVHRALFLVESKLPQSNTGQEQAFKNPRGDPP